jgi:hypothetical protein
VGDDRLYFRKKSRILRSMTHRWLRVGVRSGRT